MSSEEQREGQTIDSQVSELERFARQNSWVIEGVYKDEGWSGGLLARPELDRLRDNASKGLFNAVLLNDVDRLARDVAHLGVIKGDLKRKGVQVIFRKLPAESSPTQNLMVNILGSFAEFERELIADRTRRGKRHKVEVRQMFLGSIAPYGFRYVRKDRVAGKEGILEIHPEEAAAVRQMFEWIDKEGLSSHRIVSRLNDRAVRPRKGNTTWAKSSVLRILRSEVYTGVWHYNKFESCEPKSPLSRQKYQRSPKSSTQPRPRSEWLPVQFPKELQIIPKDVWLRVQQQLDQNLAFSPRNSRHSYLLRGLVRCAGCKARFVGDPCHGMFYYRCYARCKKVRTIREAILNEAVWGALKESILNPQILLRSVSELNRTRITQADETERDVADAEKSLRRIEAEENRLMEAYRLEVISAAQLGKELEQLNSRRSSAEAERAALSDVNRKLPLPVIENSVRSYCLALTHRLEATTIEERQRLLRLLINEISFDGLVVKIKGIIPLVSKAESGSVTGPNAPTGRITTPEIGSHSRNPGQITETEISSALPSHSFVGSQGFDRNISVRFSLERKVFGTPTAPKII